jgi:hypothetical protein
MHMVGVLIGFVEVVGLMDLTRLQQKEETINAQAVVNTFLYVKPQMQKRLNMWIAMSGTNGKLNTTLDKRQYLHQKKQKQP